MVSIPKWALEKKVLEPNTINKDGSITVNGETFKAGDKLESVCVRTGRTKWGKMYRNVTLKSIVPCGKDNAHLVLEGTSDWERAEATCELSQVV